MFVTMRPWPCSGGDLRSSRSKRICPAGSESWQSRGQIGSLSQSRRRLFRPLVVERLPKRALCCPHSAGVGSSSALRRPERRRSVALPVHSQRVRSLLRHAAKRRDTRHPASTLSRPAAGLESLLRIFDANGTPLALDNQQGGDPQLTFQAATAGTYFIGVSSAPNNNYNPAVTDSGVPGGTTGLYTLDVTRSTTTPLMPDLTGSSFRTGVDMAAAGDTVPVNFTVQNRGGADPGNFQVQVLLGR